MTTIRPVMPWFFSEMPCYKSDDLVRAHEVTVFINRANTVGVTIVDKASNSARLAYCALGNRPPTAQWVGMKLARVLVVHAVNLNGLNARGPITSGIYPGQTRTAGHTPPADGLRQWHPRLPANTDDQNRASPYWLFNLAARLWSLA